jgi:Domain of unknown function (DUF4350)
MPPGLEPSDRKFLLTSGAILGALTVVALLSGSPSGGESAGFVSSYSAASDGSKAAYTLLEELGYRVERWNQPPTELPESDNAVLIMADPLITASAEESSALLGFVRKGGRIVITGLGGARILGESGPAEGTERTFEWKRFPAELPSAVSANAPEISMGGNIRWLKLGPDQLRCYGDRQGAAVVQNQLGKGEIIWWADSAPLTNYGLTQASNLTLFLNSVGPVAPPRPRGQQTGSPKEFDRASLQRAHVLWDEYYHGDRAGLWSYLGRTPVPWFLMQLALVFAATVFTYGRRAGPIRPLRQKSRLSPLEFVETLGDLYWRKRYSAGALEVAYQRFRSLVQRRLGLASSASTEELYRGVCDQLGWTLPGFWQALQRCERGVRDSDLGDVESLHLIQELYDYSHRLGLQRSLPEDR